jgi:hypothetical protein
VEIVAWTRGCDRAGLDVPPKLKSVEAIVHVAEQACDEALQSYVPMDVDRFRDVFTRAWSAGYCSRAGLIVPEKPSAPD